MHVVTNWSGAAISRTIAACQAMNSVVCRAWKRLQARFVVDLDADHSGVVRVPSDDGADDPIGVEPEGRVREVHLLARSPRDALPGAPFARYLGVLPRQPWRHRVGGSAQDDVDASVMGAVDH